MHFVKQFNINGVDTKQVACIELHGKPNAATEGYVGVLGVDVDSPIHEVYKCVAVNGSIYTWELLSGGLSLLTANLRASGAATIEFPYDKLNTPSQYVIKVGDSVIDRDGYVYQVTAIGASSCSATYGGTQFTSYGKSAYTLAVEEGFEGTLGEWLLSLRGSRGIYVGSGEMPEYADIQIDPDSEDVDYVVVQNTGVSQASVMSQKASSESFAGALKGSVSGEAVRLDDISPIEHTMKVSVDIKNYFDINAIEVMPESETALWISSVTPNGVTITRPYGLSGVIGSVATNKTLRDVCPSIEVGKTYTIGADIDSDNSMPAIGLVSSDFSVSEHWYYGTSRTISDSDLDLYVMLFGHGYNDDAAGVVTLSNIRVVEGEIDIKAVKVGVYGKNLSKRQPTGKTATSNGVTFKVNEDGSVTANGTAADYAGFNIVSGATLLSVLKDGVSYVVSEDCVFYYINDTGTEKWTSTSFAWKSTYTPKQFYVQINKGKVCENKVIYPQLELGANSKARSDYEEYQEPQWFTPNADGTVDGIVDTGKTMTLLTDTAGVPVKIEYNRDITKAFTKLESVVNTLLGG